MRLTVYVLLAVLTSACADDSPSTPTAPTPTPAVTAVNVTGPNSFSERGASVQWVATVTLSNGTTEDRSASATWASTNASVATVSPSGTVTAQGQGDAEITATVGQVQGRRSVTVQLPQTPPPPAVNRTPDPPAGQRLPLPDIRGTIERLAAARPDLLTQQSCPRGLKYVTNPWLDYMVDELRKLDTRWGYNAKPNRSAADNGGVPVVAAGDEVTYHFGAGPDEGSPDVYPIDILQNHCGATPSVTFRVFTGEEPVRWTGAGRF